MTRSDITLRTTAQKQICKEIPPRLSVKSLAAFEKQFIVLIELTAKIVDRRIRGAEGMNSKLSRVAFIVALKETLSNVNFSLEAVDHYNFVTVIISALVARTRQTACYNTLILMI